MINKPNGLTPVKYLNGADWDGKGYVYSIPAASAQAFAIGDLVDLTGAADAVGVRNIALAVAAGPAVGVILALGLNRFGPFINPADLSVTVRPAAAQATIWYALVADDPNIIFEAQEDGVGGTIAAANGGKNVDFVYAAPAAGTRVSASMIDSSTVAVTATLPLKLMGLSPRYDEGQLMTYGANAKWLCIINSHRYRAGIATP